MSYDVDIYIEELEGVFLRITGIDTLPLHTNLLSIKCLLILSLGTHDLIDAYLLLEEEYDDSIE